MSHSKCDFGKYELLYKCSLVNLKVVNLLFGTNELEPENEPNILTFLSAKMVHLTS